MKFLILFWALLLIGKQKLRPTRMKTLKITIFFAICASAAYSQQSVDTIDINNLHHSRAGKNHSVFVKDRSLNKYIGTWAGKDGADLFKLTFQKYNHNLNNLSMESLKGSYEHIKNGKEAYSLSNNNLDASSGGKKDTLNVFIAIKSLNAAAALLAIYQKDGTIKLELEKNRFEFKKDKNFEFPDYIILTRQ